MFGGALKGIKLRDIIGGAAKAVDDSLKEDMERSQRAVERAAEYHLTRRKERQDREDEEEREIAKRFAALAGFVNKNELPEGMTIHDGAFQLYNLAGGTVERADTFVEFLDKHRFEGGSVSDLITYVADPRSGVTDPYDYVKRFVNRKDPQIINAITSAKEEDQNLYATLFKPDLDKEVREIVDLTVPPRKKEDLKQFDLTKATLDTTKSTSAEEFKLSQETKRLRNSLTQAQINEINDKINTKNALSFTTFQSFSKSEKAKAAGNNGFNLDTSGNFIIPTQGYKLDQHRKAQTEYVQEITRMAVKTTGTLDIQANYSLVLQDASKKRNDNFLVNAIDVSSMPDQSQDKFQIGRVYFGEFGKDKKKIYALYLGKDRTDAFIPLLDQG